MYNQLAPMNGSTVQFAKAYRAARSRTADRSRLATMFKRPRRTLGSR